MRLYSFASQGVLLFAAVGWMVSGATTTRPEGEARRTTQSSTIQPSSQQEASHDISSEQALRDKLELLKEGRNYLESVPGYTAEMVKREVVDGEMLPEQTLSLKCRHQPFSVYLLWHDWDPGREVIYVRGRNQGRLIGHDGGWKARLPALRLSPDSALAMRDSRYPVTQAGFLGLIDLMCEVHERDLAQRTYRTCEHEFPVQFDGRDCHAFTLVYKNAELSPTYRKSTTLIDSEWKIPVKTEHFGWPQSRVAEVDLDDETLIEAYQYTEVNFTQKLTDADFDRTNSEYAFR